jgi:LuxS protein involved in autoinducer AI2 synthesis
MHSLDEAKAIAKKVIQSGIGICRNEEIALTEEQLTNINN